MLRIGCVKYLNACPLIHGWQGHVDFDHPWALCNKLATAKLDFALVSSFEFLRNPIYRIVEDVSISSDGPVYSVVVAHRCEIDQIEEIELDPASETSVNLLRCLLAELGLKPRLIRNIDLQSVRTADLQHTESKTANNISAERTGDMPMFREACRGRLLIGDQAIRFRQQYRDEFSFWDLGEYWQKSFRLPFVYALWLIRPEVADPKRIGDRLRSLRDENLANLDDLIGQTVATGADFGPEKEVTRQFLSRYYRDHLRFSFGDKEKKGLRAFANLCGQHRLLQKGDYTLSII